MTRRLLILVALLAVTGSTAVPLSLSQTIGLAIGEIQFTRDPTGASPYVDQTVSTSGVVTAVYQDGFVIEDEAGGAWSGIFVYDADHVPSEGDEVTVTGTVTEFHGLTELAEITAYDVVSHGNPLPLPQVVSTAQVAAGEAYEGVLVATGPVTVTIANLGFGEWEITDDSGTGVRVDDKADYVYIPHVGDILETLRGVVFYSFEDFKIEPRDDRDIGLPAPSAFALKGTVVTPEEVLRDGYVVVQGQTIQKVSSHAPADSPVVDTGGLIFPGLIDAHNHPQFNLSRPIEFGRTFENRYQWQADPLYRAFRAAVDSVSDQGLECEMWKYAEMRALLAGTTAIQGSYPSPYWRCYAHPNILIHNLERMSRRIWTGVMPMTLDQGERAWLTQGIKEGTYQAVAIHLSEGVDQGSLAEFATWQGWGLLNDTTVIIHGVPYGEDQFRAMAEAGASLVWSPQSNLRLYGQTADIAAAVAQNLLVSLAPDWTPSGSYNILYELKVADRLNQERFGSALSDQDLVRMITVNPAKQFGLDDRIGRLAADYYADLVVIEGDPVAPYRALVEATPTDVRLVLVGGKAVYGERTLMAALGAEATAESIRVCGMRDRVIVAAVVSPALDESAQTYADVVGLLSEAYPQILPLDPCAAYRVYLPFVSMN